MQVECRSREEAEEAIEAGADIVMLDNFNVQQLSETGTSLIGTEPVAWVCKCAL